MSGVILITTARRAWSQLDCDILITGHTHKYQQHKYEGKLLLNPGSATGAFSGLESEVLPGFLLMDIQVRASHRRSRRVDAAMPPPSPPFPPPRAHRALRVQSPCHAARP